MSVISEAREQFATNMVRKMDDIIIAAIGECFNINNCDVKEFIKNAECSSEIMSIDKSETFIINGIKIIRILPTVVTFSDDGYTANASAKYELMYKESNVIGDNTSDQ